jgi:hypothetical protein
MRYKWHIRVGNTIYKDFKTMQDSIEPFTYPELPPIEPGE